ncbi:hypothetical protein ARTHRO9V_160200 [Arthrobacter sp. 9V]|nr:hypothetical protein ARTHRO9V_160200 [Arthrobacter sp. 9V]
MARWQITRGTAPRVRLRTPYRGYAGELRCARIKKSEHEPSRFITLAGLSSRGVCAATHSLRLWHAVEVKSPG